MHFPPSTCRETVRGTGQQRRRSRSGAKKMGCGQSGKARDWAGRPLETVAAGKQRLPALPCFNAHTKALG
jgi:hypothetical protein